MSNKILRCANIVFLPAWKGEYAVSKLKFWIFRCYDITYCFSLNNLSRLDRANKGRILLSRVRVYWSIDSHLFSTMYSPDCNALIWRSSNLKFSNWAGPSGWWASTISLFVNGFIISPIFIIHYAWLDGWFRQRYRAHVKTSDILAIWGWKWRWLLSDRSKSTPMRLRSIFWCSVGCHS